ncbi:MAG TPA: hypothetical protein VID72_00470, partial [Ktedonobacterales bacterium]
MTTAKSSATTPTQPAQRVLTSTAEPARIAPGAPDAPDASGASGAQRRGKVEVSARAIATIAAQATAECYGVVGVAWRRPRLGDIQR